MISQGLFDETLLENQEVFEYSDDEAVRETVSEFVQQSQAPPQQAIKSLEHLSLTHPSSPQGIKDREIQTKFTESLESGDAKVAISILQDLQQNDDGSGISRTRMLSLWFLMLQNNLWKTLAETFPVNEDDLSKFIPLIDFIGSLFPDSALSLHPLARDLKKVVAPFWFDSRPQANSEAKEATTLWFQLYSFYTIDNADDSLAVSLLQLARNLCNGSEDNKKSFVTGSLLPCQTKTGIDILVEHLEIHSTTNTSRVRELSRLIVVLNKFQPLAEPTEPTCTPEDPQTGGTPMVSSAHANVKEFHRTGAVPKLHRIARECLQLLEEQEESSSSSSQDLLCESLAALRTMAIDNDIVQNMIALGILDTVRDGLKVAGEVASKADDGLTSTLALATATMGLVRNLCANDEVKTTICKSSLPSILQVMQEYLNDESSNDNESGKKKRTKGHAILQEHACGILAAMALRQPQNAHAIVEAGGHVFIFDAMRAFPNKVTLQRQGCLAIRNIASRLARMSYDEDKTKLLDAGAEDILQNIAGKHPASAEEAYAALRDLGCNPQMFQMDEYGNTIKSKTEIFGEVKSAFRPVYE